MPYHSISYTITTWRCNSERWLVLCKMDGELGDYRFWVSAKRTVAEISPLTVIPADTFLHEGSWYAVPPRARAIVRRLMAEKDEEWYTTAGELQRREQAEELI